MKNYLAFLTVVALAACGGGGGSNDGAKSANQTSPTTAPATSTPAADPAASAPATAPASSSPSTPDTPSSTPQSPAPGQSGAADPSTPASSPSGASAPGGASTPVATCNPGYTTDPAAICNGTNGAAGTVYVYAIPKTVIPSNTIIRENTTWTADQSPYYLGNGVQIAANATLTIEAGAVVEGLRMAPCTNCTNYSGMAISTTAFTNAGIINVQGSPTRHAKLYGAGISNTQSGSLSIQYADLYETSLPIGNTTKLTLLDSRVEKANVNEDLSNGVRTYRGFSGPNLGQNSDVERNTFINSAGPLFDNTATIKNNLFIDMASPLTLTYVATIYNPGPTPETTSSSYAPTAVTLNSFLFKSANNSANQFAVTMYPSVGNCTGNYTCAPFVFDVSNNFWGTTDNTVIASRIVDKNTNVNLGGTIQYTPTLQAPDSGTPLDTTGLANR